MTGFAATKEGNSVVAPCGLHFALRQNGMAFGLPICGMAEAMPLTKQCRCKLFAWLNF
jgi:hypothetical protein